MKRIIAVNSNCYHGFSIEEAIEGIQKAGFHFIELTATKGWTEHVFPGMTFEYLCSVKDRLDKADLKPFSLSGHCNLMDPDRIPDFLLNMRLANFFGAQYIVSSIGEAHLKDKSVASNAEVAGHIRELAPYLEKFQLTLVLENHGDHATGEIIGEIVNLVNSPRVLINYDTANVIYYADTNPLDDLPKCIGKVGYLHIKDKIGGFKEWNFPALGKGTVDFPGLFSQLDMARNSSPLSIEIEFTKDGPQNLEAVNQAVQESAQYLRTIGLEF